jgi:hypothetical protein
VFSLSLSVSHIQISIAFTVKDTAPRVTSNLSPLVTTRIYRLPAEKKCSTDDNKDCHGYWIDWLCAIQSGAEDCIRICAFAGCWHCLLCSLRIVDDCAYLPGHQDESALELGLCCWLSKYVLSLFTLGVVTAYVALLSSAAEDHKRGQLYHTGCLTESFLIVSRVRTAILPLSFGTAHNSLSQ